MIGLWRMGANMATRLLRGGDNGARRAIKPEAAGVR
jgi:6-phosphogluconate dehydrogenase (decarboxylating)